MDFKITMVNMPNELKNGDFFRELESIRKHVTVLGLRNTSAEINSVYGFNHRLDTVEKRINDLGDNIHTDA